MESPGGRRCVRIIVSFQPVHPATEGHVSLSVRALMSKLMWLRGVGFFQINLPMVRFIEEA